MKLFITIILLINISLYNNTIALAMSANIQDVKNNHEAQLMAIPGVVSVGIGLDSDKNSVIIIGIETDDNQLKSSLPKQLDGYTVITRTVGSVRKQ